MRYHLGLLIMVVAAGAPAAFAENFAGTTDGGSLDVVITPQEEGFRMEFINPATGTTQIHIDYTVAVLAGEEYIFGPTPPTHTSPGMVTIPAALDDASSVVVEVIGILFIPIDMETATVSVADDEPEAIPDWIKTNAGWWANGDIDDETFLTGIQYLIDTGVIEVDAANGGQSGDAVPEWVKGVAGWWADGKMSDAEFLNALKFLIELGIITIQAEPLIINGVDLRYAPVYGDSAAPITIVEFGDYQCPNCRSWFMQTRPAILSEFVDPGIASLYFVDFAFIGPDSEGAAKATYCAQEKGLYWEYHDMLYQNQGGIQDGWASPASLEAFAEELGMNGDDFGTCMLKDDGVRIEFNRSQAQAAGVDRTPSFLIAGPGGVELIFGNQPFEAFQNAILALQE